MGAVWFVRLIKLCNDFGRCHRGKTKVDIFEIAFGYYQVIDQFQILDDVALCQHHRLYMLKATEDASKGPLKIQNVQGKTINLLQPPGA